MAAAAVAARRASQSKSDPTRRLVREGAEDINAIFDKFDKDVSGSIDKGELKAGLADLGVKGITHEQLERLVVQYGGEGATGLEIEQFDSLVQELRKAKKSAAASRNTLWLPKQEAVQNLYESPHVVYGVAAVIVVNFCINIVEKEIDPASQYPLWGYLDYFFNIFYLFELLFNMYGWGGPRRVFWRNTWNVFDTIIVFSGCFIMIASAAGLNLGPLKILKMLRAFRVFRLFKRVKSLNKIITAIVRCIPGVLHSFLIMIIFFSIYAILAVELFRDFGNGGEYSTTCGGAATCDDEKVLFFGNDASHAQVNVTSVTARGFTFGHEYYGTFSRAMFTLFQVMTGESWSEAIARPLIFGYSQTDAIVSGIFFVSFIIIAQFVLVNVVVAVLLDKFVTEEPEESDEDIGVEALLGGGGPAVPASGGSSIGGSASLPLGASADAKLDLMVQLLEAQRRDITALSSQVETLMSQAKLTA